MAFYLYATLTTFACLAQLLSVFFVFKKVESTDNGRYHFFRFQFLTTWAAFFYLYWTAPVAEGAWMLVSAAIVIGCQGLFFYCSSLIRRNKLSIVFSADSPQFHISKGPYSFIRHPFYTSYIFTYAAVALVVQNWYFTALCVAMFATYYFAARYEEKKFLTSNLKESYANYIRNTGMFFPKLTTLCKATEMEAKTAKGA